MDEDKNLADACARGQEIIDEINAILRDDAPHAVKVAEGLKLRKKRHEEILWTWRAVA